MFTTLKISFLLALLANGCTNRAGQKALEVKNLDSPPASLQSAQAATASRTQAGSIRNINFSNFTYDWYPKWDFMLRESKEFTLKEGRLEVEVPKGSNEPALFRLQNIQYGDVTQDNVEEAIITIAMEVWGSAAKPFVIFVYTFSSGKPERLWAHETGDRADEGLRNVYIANGQVLVIEQYDAHEIVAPNGEKTKVGMCCPPTFTRTFYRWHEGRFQTLRTERVGNEYPDARVLVGS